jgi:valyl-tRNA synthetase
MGKGLEKVYDPLKAEDKWYAYWTEHRLFHADEESSRPRYTIVIPPPNVTGMLTMGHILNNTLQDLLIRWKRMDGYEALWLPGTDHAGIATQNKVEAALQEEGLSRHDVGREELVRRIWEWKAKFGGIILKQLRKMGASCDWERERFTMDQGLSRAVREVFIRLYEKGLVYRGRRLINWCPRCLTALSNEEAPSVEKNGSFWHIAYPLEDGSGEIVVSTTRPETMLGDTAVAVHPEDKRYSSFVGKKIRLPLTGRLIPVITDEHADPDKGSGAVKITPAHDFDDFQVGLRHDLEQIGVIDERGVMNEEAGSYKGLDRFEARKKILRDLKSLNLLRGEEPRRTPIPHCYRCDTVVEPFLSEQWFVKMKPLAGPAIQAVRDGKIRLYPRHWEETYFHWMENIQDWCISRQIWWGHRIPVYTCGRGHPFVSRNDPEKCPECGDTRLEQDPDVLDTWFSSWLWPFSTLGWPDETRDLEAFFPAATLVTGPDIIFFWVARMIMASLEFMGDIPFSCVFFNGMIRDMSGRKMSKSLGNSPDPLWLINGADSDTTLEFAENNPTYRKGVPPYGADATRLTMLFLTPVGGDIHFDHTLVELGQKFCNKLWNAARFVLMNLGEEEPGDLDRLDGKEMDLADRWILSRLQKAVQGIRRSLETFRFNEATRNLYAFIWGEFCDWYLEMVKPRLYGERGEDEKRAARIVMTHVLDRILRLAHPFIPFITEEIWQSLPGREEKSGNGRSIMIQTYPKAQKKWLDPDAEKDVDLLQRVIGAIRNIRGEMNVPQDKKASVAVMGPDAKVAFLRDHLIFLERLASLDDLQTGMVRDEPGSVASALVDDLEFRMPLGDLIDVEKEKKRMQKDLERFRQILAGLEKKLSNSQFLKKAPEEVIEKEKKKLADFQAKREKLERLLQQLREE